MDEDAVYNNPYVDVDELRTDPVAHRYVHGGFAGTDAKFSLYFPPAGQYQGRFFQNTYPMALSEDVGPFPIAFDVATGDIGFTIASGAYYLQTNLGGADRMPPADPAIAAYRVNAAAARFSRVKAAELFGDHRPYGYLFGGSGGSYQVIGAAEHTSGVWDGFVPFVFGSPNAIPSLFTVRMHALRVLRDRFGEIMDAIDVGGSGDPYATLNAEERAALREATLLGFPPRGWWSHETLDSGYFSNVADLTPTVDPTYVEDFWSKPGHLGADPTSSIQAARRTGETTLASAAYDFPMRVDLATKPEWDITNAHLVFADGRSIPIAHVDGLTVTFAISTPFDVLAALRPGDAATIDNSWPLALETYQRHQVPTPDLYGWNQFRDATGEPLYPQRARLVGPIAAAATVGGEITGRITARTLQVQCLMDIDAMAWQADWYRSKVREAGLGDRFALWFVDRAQHDDPRTPTAHAHVVSYRGVLQQALRDVAAWVERDVHPGDTAYEVVDTQVVVPARAADRGGVQPVVDLTVNGAVRAEVPAGATVTLEATIEVPPGAGDVVAAEWDFAGEGTYPVTADLGSPRPTVRLTATHAYTEPGTYFPVLRATSQREGDAAAAYGRVQNIARARVIVLPIL